MIKFIQNLFNPPLKLTEDEARVKTVIEKLLANNDTKFRFAPLTNSILLKQKEKEYYLLIDGSHIKISNHTFSLDKQFRLNFIENMKTLIFTRMESDRIGAINEIFKNERNLLDGMINSLTPVPNNPTANELY